MTIMKLIDKTALVAEIERLISNGKLKCQQSQENNDQVSYVAWSEHIATCGKILSIINSLEVKEVDLKKEIGFYIETSLTGTNPIYTKGAVSCIIEKTAKDFFELGIEKSIDESIIRKIVELDNEAVKHYDTVIKKENEENGFSQLAIDLFEHNVDTKELCVQYIIENLKAQKGEKA